MCLAILQQKNRKSWRGIDCMNFLKKQQQSPGGVM